jgi:hypothetical protein
MPVHSASRPKTLGLALLLMIGACRNSERKSPLASGDTIPDAIQCATCRIEVKRLVTLRSAPERMAALAVDSRGRIVVTDLTWKAILVYDTNGRLLQRLGRVGRGPGEFMQAGYVTLGSGDSLYVHDRSLRRITVRSPLPRSSGNGVRELSYGGVGQSLVRNS